MDPASTPPIYQFRIASKLDRRWAAWFGGLELGYEIIAGAPCVTTLTGTVIDQSALHGILVKLRDLNVTLLSVNILSDTGSSQKEIHDEPQRAESEDRGQLPGPEVSDDGELGLQARQRHQTLPGPRADQDSAGPDQHGPGRAGPT
jgi:hypothetical protein